MQPNKILQIALSKAARSDLEVAIDTCRLMIEQRLIISCPSRKVKNSILFDIDHLVSLNRTHAIETTKGENKK